MVNNNMKKEIIRFHSKISRILSFFMLLVIPALIIILIYNFNVFAMLGIITINIFIILIVYWINSRGVIIDENKIIFLEFYKKEFLIKDIESLNIGKIGDIVIIYNGKEFHKVGYIDFLFKFPNEGKNKDLINKINQLRKHRGY